ncbi:hypothetical protein HHX47_DHR4000681 [Lentinula edodes]|nr:hypothetical protein HHX47_DHR4000681 [Lentinula edodes]
MVNWVKVLYESGARNFIFQNINPLQHTILYSSTGYYTKFWTFPRNATSWSVSMTELALSGNDLTQLKLQALLPQIPDAHVAHFDSHSLFQDMFDNPSQYLNGTAPLNVTGCINSCVFQVNEPDSGVCTLVNGTDRDSYLWYDELHPSEQADRIVAREMALVMEGKTNSDPARHFSTTSRPDPNHFRSRTSLNPTMNEHLTKPTKYDIEDSNIALLGSDLEKRVREHGGDKETAWNEAGATTGLQIWRIEKFHVVPWSTAEEGRFYDGDSYIVLYTYKKTPESESFSYNLHFWLGDETSQDEAGTAAYKTVELDDRE